MRKAKEQHQYRAKVERLTPTARQQRRRKKRKEGPSAQRRRARRHRE